MSDQSTTAPVLIGEKDLCIWPYPVEESSIAAKIIFLGIPLAKQRPRFTRSGRAYTPNPTREYESAIRSLFQAETRFSPPDCESRFAIRCLFFRHNRQRIDCDNLIKAVSDAATRVVWGDDSQVVEVFGRLNHSANNPRVEVLIYRVPDPNPKPTCETCGDQIISCGSRPRRFCSIKCANESHRITIACRECKHEFTVAQSSVRNTKKTRTFCSKSCAMRSHRRSGVVPSQPKRGRRIHPCPGCGGPISKPNYKECRACRLAANPEENSRRWKSSQRVESNV